MKKLVFLLCPGLHSLYSQPTVEGRGKWIEAETYIGKIYGCIKNIVQSPVVQCIQPIEHDYVLRQKKFERTKIEANFFRQVKSFEKSGIQLADTSLKKLVLEVPFASVATLESRTTKLAEIEGKRAAREEEIGSVQEHRQRIRRMSLPPPGC